jgi:hypothetical protein
LTSALDGKIGDWVGPEPVWTLWSRDKFLALQGIEQSNPEQNIKDDKQCNKSRKTIKRKIKYAIKGNKRQGNEEKKMKGEKK